MSIRGSRKGDAMATEEYEINFMDKLWEAANRLRGKMESSQYKHIVLPLIFLKYISDMFESRRKWLWNSLRDPNNQDYYLPNASEEDINNILEDRDEYLSAGVFYVPEKARWEFLMKNATRSDRA
jgi:type I restriction enzyme M protein